MEDKKPSGAEFRRRRKEAAETARRTEVARVQAMGASRAEHGAASYRDVGAPPLGDPTMGLIYAQNMMLVALAEVANDSFIESEQRWKLISELGGKIGMTHAKALVQHKLDKVTKKLSVAKDESGGTQNLKANAVTKPATARGGVSGGRVESIAQPLPDPEASED